MHRILLLVSFFLLHYTSEQFNIKDRKDLDTLIDGIIAVDKPTTNTDTTDKHSSNSSCQCVPYYLCINDTIITDGSHLIDKRVTFNWRHDEIVNDEAVKDEVVKDETVKDKAVNDDWAIDNNESICDYLSICCKMPSDIIPPEATVPKTDGEGGGDGGGTSSVSTANDTTNFCGIRNPNGVDTNITVNSDNQAEYGEIKWMLAILKKHYDNSVKELLYVCGASLITHTVVLTSADCVYNAKNSDIKVRAGEWDVQTHNSKKSYKHQESDVKQIIIHEGFTSHNLFNNVALLILAKPFDVAPHIGTICLPSQGQVFSSKECFASGWGKNIYGRNGRYQTKLKKIQLPTISHDQCESSLRKTRLEPFFKLHYSFTCAGGEVGKDMCTGDGGGPLVCPDPNNPDRYMQVGIVAWGIECGRDNVPGVYTDVAKFRTWITNHMARLNLDTTPFIV